MVLSASARRTFLASTILTLIGVPAVVAAQSRATIATARVASLYEGALGTRETRIDPDRATDEVNRTNTVISASVSLAHPALALADAEVSATPPLNRPQSLVFRIRNKSRMASRPPTEMELTRELTGGPSTRRFPVPALGPCQLVSIGVVWRDVLRCTTTSTRIMEITSRIDPDDARQWADDHERDGRYILHVAP